LGEQCATTRPRHHKPPSAAPSSPLTTNAPVGGSGADAGRLAHWSQPGGGTSSSGTSTTTARRLPAAAGASKVDGAATATTVVAVMTIAACCGSATVDGCCGSATVAACCGSAAVDGCRGSATVAASCASAAITARIGSVAVAACCGSEAAAVPREPSLAAFAVLTAACDALDERRLVGTAASDLSTLAGARGGARWALPCERESKKVKPSLVSKMRCVGQWSPTSGWRILVSSSSGARQTLWPPPAWPPPHPRSSQWRAPAPPRRTSPLS
jgi:hypothetical protein